MDAATKASGMMRRPRSGKSVRTTISLSAAVAAKLECTAQREGKTRSLVLHEILIAHWSGDTSVPENKPEDTVEL